VYDIVTDYACYPRIFPEFTGARVVKETDPVRRVEFRARVVVEVRYVLDITHDPEKLETRWTYVEGEVVSDSVGGWAFSDDGAGGTKIAYHAGMAVKAPLPRFIVNKISNALMGSSIPNMFRALEREAHARARFGSAPPVS
jgi:ribosome-associated toxin RatA of RatAB toxin-antitoxin module